MFADQLRAAVTAARSDVRLVELSRTIWQGHAAGALDDQSAQSLSELVQAHRVALRGPQAAPGQIPGRPSIFPPKRPQRSPDRVKSVERRRTLAASGPLPPALAARFTTGELSVLKVIADEIRMRGVCELHVDAIAARAGVSPSTMRNARRTAEQLGYISVEERRRQGQRNDTNRIMITDPSWQAWIKKDQRSEGGGFKTLKPTDKKIHRNEIRQRKPHPQKGYRNRENASFDAANGRTSVRGFECCHGNGDQIGFQPRQATGQPRSV